MGSETGEREGRKEGVYVKVEDGGKVVERSVFSTLSLQGFVLTLSRQPQLESRAKRLHRRQRALVDGEDQLQYGRRAESRSR
jgi:hypothetical protein